jgi:hypothetical protein
MKVSANLFGINLLLIFYTLTGYSQKVGKYSNEFLNIGIGAKALSMANASTAITDDVTAGYWNPAGLVENPSKIQAGAMHAEYFAGISKFDYLGVLYKISDSTACAFSAIRFGVDDIPNTLDLRDKDGNIDYNRIKLFSVADYAFLFSYAKKTRIAGLHIGGNVKIIYRNQAEFAKAWGFGIDAGVQYQTGRWHFGITGKDLTSTFNVWSYNEEKLKVTYQTDSTQNIIPDNSLEITAPRLICGLGYKYNLNEKFSILAAFDADLTFDGKRNVILRSKIFNLDPHVGFEIGYIKMVYLRFGVGNIQRISDFSDKETFSLQPNLGLGIKIKNLEIDYALTNVGDKNLYSNIFSLKYNFLLKK